MAELAGVVLAAGLSSRMGAYKPLMQVDGESMSRRVVSMMHAAGAEPVLVVTGYRRDALEDHLRGMGVRFVYNSDYAVTQQLESLRLALARLEGKCRRVLICPADVPLVGADTVQALLALPGDFVRPVWHGEVGHPVVLDAGLIPYLMAYDGPGGLRGAVERSGCRLRELQVEDRGTVLDNDTPQDVERLLRWKKQVRDMP